MSAALRRNLIALFLGAATVLGFAPFGVFVLPALTLAVLFRLWCEEPGGGPRALLGFAFGFGFFLAGVSWVFVSMHDFGGMPASLAALATVLFSAYLALYPAVAGYASALLHGRAWWVNACGVAALWTVAEWLRGWMLTGFPWLALGYAQSPPSPLAGFAPVLGVYGMTLATALAGALIATAWVKGRRELWVAAVCILGLAGAGAALRQHDWTRPVGEPLTVGLLQGNIEQSLKWKPERYLLSLETYLELARRHPARLVILPETALPTTLEQLPPDYADALGRAAGAGNDVLMGIVIREDGRHWNSAVALGKAATHRYDKRHLVPFGEFTPPLFQWTLSLLSIPMSDFSRGPAAQAPLAIAGQSVAVNICYEDIFGEEIIRALPEATLLVNLSNTAWFGDSLAQPQHLQIARVRAMETGRTMLRATNTGITAVVDPRGHVDGSLAPFSTGGLVSSVQGHEGMTPYATIGNAGPLALCAVLLAAGWARRSRRREPD